MPARRLAWQDTIFDSTTLAAGILQEFDLLANAPTSDTLTVERILVDVWYFPGPTNENEGLAQVSFGIGVASQEAFAANILPDPQSQTEYPARGWLYVATQPALQTMPSGGTPAAMWRMDCHFKADIRARRKIDKGILFLNTKNLTVSGDLTLFRQGRVRVLCRT